MIRVFLFILALWALSSNAFAGPTQTTSVFGCGTATVGSLIYCEQAEWSPFLANALSTTVKNVKTASGGILGMVQCYNPNSSQIYVQVFNVVAASVTLGTTTPILSIGFAQTSSQADVVSMPGVVLGGTGISIAATTTATGSTAPSTAPDCNVLYN